MAVLRRFVACALVSMVVLGSAAGCGSTAVDRTLIVDGETSLLHYLPGSSPRPLVVVLHGLGGTGGQMRRVTGLSAFADRNGFSVVYPDAHRVGAAPNPALPTSSPSPTVPPPSTPTRAPTSTPTPPPTPPLTISPTSSVQPPPPVEPTSTLPPQTGPSASPELLQAHRVASVRSVNEVVAGAPSSSRAWNAGTTCCGGAAGDDVAYLRRVVAAVAARVPVDRHRVYVVGLSNGGMMATRAICDAPDLFAAAATVAGPYLGSRCARPVWKHLHGGEDPFVPYLGGVSPGVPGLGIAHDWCRCRFPSSATEATRFGGYVSVTYVASGTHSWPTLDGPWHLDGNAAVWRSVSLFRR